MYLILLTCTLFLVVGSSAFMSISGLLTIFSDHTVMIICMGLGIEAGKILSVSHLYRTWGKNGSFGKVAFMCIILALTILTSFEVLAFLSANHQRSTNDTHLIQVQLNALSEEAALLRKQIQVTDQTLNGLPASFVTRRIDERKAAGYEDKQQRLLEIIKQKERLGQQQLFSKKGFDSITAIAMIFNIDKSVVASIFIPLLTLILEPFGIGLTIATNSAWLNQSKKAIPIKSKSKSKTKSNNTTDKLQELSKKHGLSAQQIAKITGRKKQSTCESWLIGSLPTPPRALVEIQNWVKDKQQQE